MVKHGSKFNKKFELSLSAAQATIPAHSRGRCILGFNVPEADKKIELVDLTAEKLGEIMNMASKDAKSQFNSVITGDRFHEPDKGIKTYLKTKIRGICTSKNLASLVNLYGQCGRTTLPGSSRLGRYTLHHLKKVYYSRSCEVCTMRKPGQVLRFTYKRGKKVITARGKILFLSYVAGKSEFPVNAWCKHVSTSCICWVKQVVNEQFYRTTLTSG